MIIQGLREIQNRRGYLPDEELELLALRERVSLARIYEVASFYPTFRRAPPHPVEVGICRDLSCQMRGATKLLSDATESFQHEGDRICVEGVSCLGRCDHAPVVQLRHHKPEGRRWVTGLNQICQVPDLEWLKTAIDAVKDARTPAARLFVEDLLAHHEDRRGTGSPNWEIDIYDRAVHPDVPPPYESVRRFQRNELTPELIQAALEMAELEGMGGAAGRASYKWKSVRKLEGEPKYVVCNGDESEPGAFKDRELMLRVPHLIVEAMVLALRFLNAKEGYIYVRHEYQAGIEALRTAVRDAEDILCRDKVFGPDLPFRIEVVESPGGYICGEQSALLEALRGQRAQPRLQNMAADIQVSGLDNKPTILNNVETLAWVPAVVLKDGGRWYAARGFGNSGFDEGGKPKSADRYKGLRFFSISGDVNRPGVYEVPIGTPLRDLIHGGKYAQGMRDGQELRALAPSGPSGGFLAAEFEASELRSQLERGLRRLEASLRQGRGNERDKARLERFRESLVGSGRVSVLDLELAAPLFRALGAMLGPGIVVYGQDSTTDMIGPARCAAEFFRNESCGKCVPCRLGSQQLADLATRLANGNYTEIEWKAEGAERMIEALGVSLELTSICSLGRVAVNPLATLIKHFPADVSAHLR
jgi:NADH:ubiquinone oxidoreductase subunit F (NADH-binding)